MSPAFLFLLLAGMIVLLFSLERYQSRSDLPGFLGFLGGLWTFLGLFFIPTGIVGFSYFIIALVLFLGALLSALLLPRDTGKKINELLKPIHSLLDSLPEIPSASAFVTKRARRIQALHNVGEKLLILCFVIFSVLILYLAFFMSIVTPVEPNDDSGFEEKDSGLMKVLPYTYKKEYVYETAGVPTAYVAIVTIRSVPLSGDILSRGVDEAAPEAEDHIEDEFGGDATITLIKERDKGFNGHDGISKEYEVTWKEGFVTVHGTMMVDVWYCHQNMKIVAVAYFYPDELESRTRDLVDSIHCH